MTAVIAVFLAALVLLVFVGVAFLARIAEALGAAVDAIEAQAAPRTETLIDRSVRLSREGRRRHA